MTFTGRLISRNCDRGLFFFFFKFRRKVLAQLQETSLQNKREARQEDRSDLSHRCLTVVFFVQRNVLCNFFLFFFFEWRKRQKLLI